jgi:GTPase SAR1 family protein
VGIEFATKPLDFEKSVIQTTIWDTAGQERIHKMTKAYYRNCAGAILVYDVCNRDSFFNLRTIWLKQLREQGYKDVRLILGEARC